MNRPVRLLHIPKTAGTTIASSLVRVYGRKHAFPFSGHRSNDRDRLLALDGRTRAGITLYYGHSFFDTGVEEADRARIITFLREPVDRVKSFIQHAGERKGKYLAGQEPDEPFTVSAFLDTSNPELSNLQTKILLNLDDAGLEALGEDAAFELARQRLFDGLAAFGIQSRFDEGWVAIWNALGRKPPLYVHLRRIRKTARLPFSPGDIERIREMNRLDIRLYEAAESEFERRMDSGIIPRSACEKFKARQAMFGPAYSTGWHIAKKIARLLKRSPKKS